MYISAICQVYMDEGHQNSNRKRAPLMVLTSIGVENFALNAASVRLYIYLVGPVCACSVVFIVVLIASLCCGSACKEFFEFVEFNFS